MGSDGVDVGGGMGGGVGSDGVAVWVAVGCVSKHTFLLWG